MKMKCSTASAGLFLAATLLVAGVLDGAPAAAQNAAAPAAPAAVDPGAVVVSIDHAKIVRLPERVQTVVVGNPIVADVTVQRNGILVVTGKSYGTTNLIALDNAGNMLVETSIRVQASNEATVTVHRGLERETYSCAPTCQPSLLLGDAQRYFGEVSGQATQRNTLATQR